VSRSKNKGTAAETAVVRFLRAAGFTQAERRTLSGAQDRGDIAGVPGVVIEVKNCARQELPAWVAEAELERDNDRASLGVVWHKRRGTTDPGRWFVTMSGDQFAALLREQQGLPTPAVEERIVAYRSLGGRILRCLNHVPPEPGDDFVPVTSDDLPDGGLCTHPQCGVDVLIQRQGGEAA